MIDISFANPYWVHLLWVVLAFVALLLWLQRRGGGALNRLVSATLQERLLTGPSSTRRLTRMVLLGLSGVFLTLALMRPQWGTELVQSERASAEIMICLDVSRSMLAEDVVPNRLQRAKAEVRDLLGLLEGDHVGLIAFAGRASVLAPLTPDFGFVRLALDDAGPYSVSRGGTRLEEPIRKAIAGFGDADAVARSIILITDGEDHDSFPLEAAQAAAERGIRILAIGFGDENGAEIPITNPDTGAREMLRDGDGQIVRSRLDGDLLRDMALRTDGAYIPAATGVLDLESIYQRHIAPLTRGQLDGHTQTIRNDAFQWAILLALLALCAAAISGTRMVRRKQALQLVMAGAAVILSGWANPNQAQSTDPEAPLISPGEAADTSAADAPSDRAAPQVPRLAYNEGLSQLDQGQASAAAELLGTARDQAGTDGELRFRATYNLGWAEVRAADQLIESEPAEALEHLYRAAAWFREAVSLRPGQDDARYNLEIVMRRALQLADAIAEREEGDLRQQLEQLIEAQRAFLNDLRGGVVAEQDSDDPNVGPELRRHLRGLAGQQLTVLADAEQLSERAAREIERLTPTDDQAAAEDALRRAQVEGMISHLHRARERITQARTRLRRMQGERAYRRSAAALSALQRARDQLLDPVARLDTLINDSSEIAQLTATKAAWERALASLASAPEGAPDWLTVDYLSETQQVAQQRLEELHLGLEAGLGQTGNGPPPSEEMEPEQARLLEQLRAATPLIGQANSDALRAYDALAAAQLDEALQAQSEALANLLEAREHLLDLRRLIELIYTDQRRIGQALVASAQDQTEDDRPNALDPTRIAPATALQQRNLERAQRLGQMLTDAMIEAVPEGQAAASGGAGDGGQSQAYEQAFDLLTQAQQAMHAAATSLPQIDSAASPALAQSQDAVTSAISHLEQLRRLFFSLLDHLKETAQRQQQLGDETEALATLLGPDEPPKDEQTGPLGHRQQSLAETAKALSEGLRQQASAGASDKQDPASAQARQEQSERLTQAAQWVTQSSEQLSQAAQQLQATPATLEPTREAQQQGLHALAEAIALLQDSQQQQQQDQQQDQQQQQQNEQGGDQQQQQPENAGAMDLSQLLQGVRDREAQRREQQARQRGRQGYQPVEKDW